MDYEHLKSLQDTNAATTVARDAYRNDPSEKTWERYQDAIETSAGVEIGSEVCGRLSEPIAVSELAEDAEQKTADIAELERRKARLTEGDPYRVMLDRWIAESK